MAKGGSTSKIRPGAGAPAGEQMTDQIAFIQINQETHVFFRNHFKQIIALADSPLDTGALEVRNGGIRIHLVPKISFATPETGIFCRINSRCKHNVFLNISTTIRSGKYQTVRETRYLPKKAANAPNTVDALKSARISAPAELGCLKMPGERAQRLRCAARHCAVYKSSIAHRAGVIATRRRRIQERSQR
ncbi:MAG: hypothetical protein WA820_12415 [Bradyrhizobium sp.]|jgi:hypothetical protein